jgi:hypothetical protein
MARCPSCDYPLHEDRERVGARCPHCFDPLYERPGRTARRTREGEGACVVHKDSEVVGVCGRCGNYLCEVCRTRWRDKALCAACVERALETSEAAPEQTRTHFRQAMLGLGLGVGAWVVTLLAFLLFGLLAAASGGAAEAVAGALLFVLLGLLAGMVTALLGVGQAAAALRTRGNHMILATVGLILSGLYVGVLVGFFGFSIWMA